MAETEQPAMVIVTAPEGIDSANLADFRRDLDNAGKRTGEFLVADLSGTTHVTYPGLGVLNDARHRCNMAGKHLIVVCTTEDVLAAFRRTGLTKIFDLRAEMPDLNAELGGDQT